MDSLGGILTKGLLGNLIIARFSLFVDIIIEDITPTPTPTVTPTPTTTPIPVPIVGGGGGALPDHRIIKVTVIYKGREHVSIHKVNDKTLRININILKGITYIKDTVYSVAVSIRKTINNIKVTIHGNGN